MAVSVPYQQQFTWRKLGYLFYQDSLSYREVLEQNPQWVVTKQPPIGAQLRLQKNSGNAGKLTQGSFIFGLPLEGTEDQIFPFVTEEEYKKALYRYNLQGVVDRNVINGYSQDSMEAVTGQQ
jgi:hypothetical protein